MKSLLINDKLYWSSENWTFLQFCFIINIENIPRFCYHEQLTVAGNCRMCLVEDIKSLKPVVACTIIPQDSSVLFTNSVKVKKAREAMLEFLLINHPLDCPICCQGGECDLQDLTEIIGSDRGRYYDNKRAVLDKNLGPIIKTSMNRCIHCTRCIRFSLEITNSFQLGILGRGNNMEIGTYLDLFLSHEFQGNLIDICPVGASTSKLYAYNARPWECENYILPNIFDSFLDNIRIEIRGNKIIRILPVYNIFWKNEWLSDFNRYLTEKLYSSRIKTPMFKLKIFFIKYSWVNIFNIIKSYFFNSIKWLILNKLKYIEFIYSFNTTISFSTYNLIITFIKQLSLSNQKFNYKNDLLTIKTQMKNIFDCYQTSYIFILVPFFRYKYPQFYINMNNQMITNSDIKHIFSFQTIVDSFNFSNISFSQIKLILLGKINLSINLNNNKTLIFISIFNNLFNNWYKKINKLFFKVHSILYHLDFEKQNNIFISNNSYYSNTLKIFYNIESLHSQLNNSTKTMYIYQGSFVNKYFEFANIILPMTFGYEESLSQKKILQKITNLYLLSNYQIKKIKKIIWNNTNIKNSEDIILLFQIYNGFFNSQNFINYNYIYFNSYKINQELLITNFIIFLFSFKHYFVSLLLDTEQSDLLKHTFNSIFNNLWINL